MQNQDAAKSEFTGREIPLDMVDDVEAHGLREVAIGVSAAALIGGGVAAVVSQTGSTPSFAGTSAIELTPSTTELAAHTAGSVTDSVKASDLTSRTVSAAQRFADREDSAINALASSNPTVGSVQQGTDNLLSVSAAGSSVVVNSDVNKKVDATTADALNTTGTVASASVSAADTTKNYATETAGHTVANTESSALKNLHKAEATAIHIVSSTRLVMGGWATSVKILGTEIQGNVALLPTGEVTVKDSSGAVVGSATLHNGTCTIQIAAAHVGSTFTLHYPGDSGHLGSVLRWDAPSE